MSIKPQPASRAYLRSAPYNSYMHMYMYTNPVSHSLDYVRIYSCVTDIC